MKKIVLWMMALAVILGLTACDCKHKTWLSADCLTPKTCADCGETEGAPLGHNWAVADCEHPKSCRSCGITQGEALGHSWMPPTTEAPKTCTGCGKTEGLKIVTDPRFTTASCQPLFGRWKSEITKFFSASDILGVRYDTYIEFFNDGSLKVVVEIPDPEACLEAMLRADMEAYYAIMAEQGYSREKAAEEFEKANGKDIETFYRDIYGSADVNQILGVMDEYNYVYYVEGNQFYYGSDWSAEMAPASFQILDGNLYLLKFMNSNASVIFYPSEIIPAMPDDISI